MEGLPPGPREPAALQTVEWVARPTDLLRRSAARYGEPFTLRTLWADAPMVVVSDPETVRRIYATPPDVLRGGASSAVIEPFVGPSSVLVLDGGPHLRERRVLLPPLHGERMQAHRDAVVALARAEIARWPAGVPLPTLPRMQALTLEVIMRVVFGSRDERLRAALRGALDVTTSLPRLVSMALTRPGAPPWRRFQRAVARLDATLAAVVRARRTQQGPPAVVDELIAAAHSQQQLRDQLVTLLAAGHETTAGSLAWALERLARHPHVQERMRADGDAYVDAVVKEVLRVRPVLSATPRQAAVPYTVGGWTVPAGVHVTPCIYLAHRRPELWPDPTAFRPERFLDGAPEPFAWLPFGGGTRRCAGAAFATMELTAVLGAVASAVDVRPDRPAGERMRRRGVTLMPARGGRVVVVPRDRSSSVRPAP
jgi:cytochrome P450 family 135